MKYVFMYRCRYCGEEYIENVTGDEKLAFKCLVHATYRQVKS